MTGDVATYRIQVGRVGGLDAVAELAPYLAELGVTTLYLSPVLRSRSDSDHGYDVVDPGRVDPGLGGEEALGRLGEACRDHGLSMLLDVVPNHMAASHENSWWWSVLEEGPASPRSGFFDVDWDEPPEPVRGRVVLPILGRRYHRVLESGELQVARGRDGWLLRYFDHVLPLDVSSRAELTGEAADRLVDRLNRAGDDPEARRELDRLLVRQAYWLVHWRTAPEEINYRRFFNIADLVALRMEREEVFRAWHRMLAELLDRFPVSGLRVDHVDGLRDPGVYLDRLRDLVGGSGRDRDSVTLLVEKILAPDEALPATWDVDGTTGYDFLAAVDALQVSPEGLASLRERYRSFTGSDRRFRERARRAKRKVARAHFRRDLDRLVERALPLVRGDPRGRDLARSEVEAALLEITVQLRVYRTYVTGEDGPTGDARAPLDEAVARARKRRRGVPAAAFPVLRALLAGEAGGDEGLELLRRWQQLTGAVMAKGVEDTTFYLHQPLISLNEVGSDPDAAPLAVPDFHAELERRGRLWPRTLNATSTHDTKRSEDVRARIHVLSELAGEWGRRVERWHEWNRPLRGRAGSRAVPTPNEEWLLYQTLVGVWPLEGGRETGPSPELLGRVEAFALKAAREAKAHTSWLRPRRAHEKALGGFVRRILEPGRDEPFLDDFLEIQEKVAFHGAVNSLSQVLLKLAAPGTPDFYQGNELWRFSLVDPDNRRPVDWEHRRAFLGDLERRFRIDERHLADLLDGWKDGRIKLLSTWRGLAARRRRPDLFGEGGYRPLEATGARSGHVIAFARRLGDEWVVAVAPRLPAGLTPAGTFPLGSGVWKDTTVSLPDGDAPPRWRDAITGSELDAGGEGGRLEMARVLERFPVALLEGR